ncbi:nusB family domain-containing protein [Ditylenchus destructor]|nr:nusB family domain-containing protein [Ditylenchus destructor]
MKAARRDPPDAGPQAPDRQRHPDRGRRAASLGPRRGQGPRCRDRRRGNGAAAERTEVTENDKNTPAGKPAAKSKRQAGAKRAPAKSARRRSREHALQGIYQWLVTGEEPAVVDAHTREQDGFDRRTAATSTRSSTARSKEAADLDAVLARHADRKTTELSPIEHAILMIGAYELKNCIDTPYGRDQRGGRAGQVLRRHGRSQVRQRRAGPGGDRPASGGKSRPCAALEHPLRSWPEAGPRGPPDRRPRALVASGADLAPCPGGADSADLLFRHRPSLAMLWLPAHRVGS